MILRVKFVRWLFIAITATGLVSSSITFFAGGKINWWREVYSMVFSLLGFGVFWLVVLAVGCALMMLLRPKYFKNVTFTFTHWGMEKSGSGFLFTRQWNKFTGFRESKHFFFLYIADNDAHIIPKRLLDNNEEINEFRRFIIEHLQQRG